MEIMIMIEFAKLSYVKTFFIILCGKLKDIFSKYTVLCNNNNNNIK